MPPETSGIEPLIAAERAGLESMTPVELDNEYTHMLSEPLPQSLSRGDLIEQISARLRQQLLLPRELARE